MIEQKYLLLKMMIGAGYDLEIIIQIFSNIEKEISCPWFCWIDKPLWGVSMNVKGALEIIKQEEQSNIIPFQNHQKK